MGLLEQKGYIERLDGPTTLAIGLQGEGWRFSDNLNYAFIDVYWQKVSNHYLIQQRDRRRNLVMSRGGGLKPISGPYPIEILDPETSTDFVTQRCLEILRREVKNRGLDMLLERDAPL